MPRPKYKTLYLHNLQAYGEEKDRRKAAEREVWRLNGILGEEGKKILARIDDGTGSIRLHKFAYECVTAFIRTPTYNFQLGALQCNYWMNFGIQLFTWRGRPIQIDNE